MAPSQEADLAPMDCSPPVVADLNGDGKNEVMGIPNAEKQVPYVTQFFALWCTKATTTPHARDAPQRVGKPPAQRQNPRYAPKGYYPPDGIPAPTIVNIQGDKRPEIIAALNDGYIHALTPDGKPLWKYDYRHGRDLLYASEVVVADLNKDGVPELIFFHLGANPKMRMLAGS